MIYALEKFIQLLKVTILSAIKLPLAALYSAITFPWKFINFLDLQIWDTVLYIGNLVTPLRAKGHVVKAGKPGHGGVWPPFVPPTKDDSRAPCPYLNAMANHGILPHHGKNIPLKVIGDAMTDCFNFSPTLVKDTVNSVAGLYGRDYISLSDLAAHNVVEHDASLVRHDAYFAPDQTVPAHDLINDLLNSARGPKSKEFPEGYLIVEDISRNLDIRNARSKRDNPVYKMGFVHSFFGLSNGSLMYEVAHGDVRALRTILHEERLPDGFESHLRQRFGYTMKDFHTRSLEIFLGMSNNYKLPPNDVKTEDAIHRAANLKY